MAPTGGLVPKSTGVEGGELIAMGSPIPPPPLPSCPYPSYPQHTRLSLSNMAQVVPLTEKAEIATAVRPVPKSIGVADGSVV